MPPGRLSDLSWRTHWASGGLVIRVGDDGCSRTGGCQKFCVWGGFHILIPVKRSPYMMAN